MSDVPTFRPDAGGWNKVKEDGQLTGAWVWGNSGYATVADARAAGWFPDRVVSPAPEAPFGKVMVTTRTLSGLAVNVTYALRDADPIEVMQQKIAMWAAHVESAQAELKAADAVAMRCLKAGVPYPAEWLARDVQLRAITRVVVPGMGEDPMTFTGDPTQPLPQRPAWPAGTD